METTSLFLDTTELISAITKRKSAARDLVDNYTGYLYTSHELDKLNLDVPFGLLNAKK